jgi:hypothetical protein
MNLNIQGLEYERDKHSVELVDTTQLNIRRASSEAVYSSGKHSAHS